MSREAEELLAVAAKLPADERAKLVVRLLDTIAAPEGTESVEDAQREESLARLEAARAGDIELIEHDDAMRMIAD